MGEKVLLAACRNSLCSLQMICRLLEVEGSVITEDVLVATATNEGEKDAGRPLMKFLVTHKHNTLGVSKRVLKAALCNKVHGRSLAEFQLSRPQQQGLTNEFLDLAKSNDQSGRFILRSLLDAAVLSNQNSFTAEVLDVIQADRDGLQDALLNASLKNKAASVFALITRGADPNQKAGEIGNALHVASFAGSEASVRILLDNGAKVNQEGGQHGMALTAAAVIGHTEIA